MNEHNSPIELAYFCYSFSIEKLFLESMGIKLLDIDCKATWDLSVNYWMIPVTYWWEEKREICGPGWHGEKAQRYVDKISSVRRAEFAPAVAKGCRQCWIRPRWRCEKERKICVHKVALVVKWIPANKPRLSPIGLGCKTVNLVASTKCYKVNHFTILKALYPTGQSARSRKNSWSNTSTRPSTYVETTEYVETAAPPKR